MGGQTSTKTNIKFFVDLEDDVSYRCSCSEAGGTQWKRTRNLPIKKPSVHSSSLSDADINFIEMGTTDLCELQQNTWAPLPKPLVDDSGAGETVMPVDWLSSHLLTESDASHPASTRSESMSEEVRGNSSHGPAEIENPYKK